MHALLIRRRTLALSDRLLTPPNDELYTDRGAPPPLQLAAPTARLSARAFRAHIARAAPYPSPRSGGMTALFRVSRPVQWNLHADLAGWPCMRCEKVPIYVSALKLYVMCALAAYRQDQRARGHTKCRESRSSWRVVCDLFAERRGRMCCWRKDFVRKRAVRNIWHRRSGPKCTDRTCPVRIRAVWESIQR